MVGRLEAELTFRLAMSTSLDTLRPRYQKRIQTGPRKVQRNVELAGCTAHLRVVVLSNESAAPIVFLHKMRSNPQSTTCPKLRLRAAEAMRSE